jgi:hypothetical protein
MAQETEEWTEPEVGVGALREEYFEGESVDLEVTLKNSSKKEMNVPGVTPGNNAVKFLVTGPAGKTLGPLDDNTVRGRLRQELHLSEASEPVKLPPGSETRERYDLLQMTGDLEPGAYRVIALYPEFEIETEPTSFTIVPAARPVGAGTQWEYDRGALSLGYCAWVASGKPSSGIHLRIYDKDVLDFAFSNRRIAEETPEQPPRLSRASIANEAVRYACWGSGGKTRALHLVRGEPEGKPADLDVPGAALFLTDPHHRLWVVWVQERKDGWYVGARCPLEKEMAEPEWPLVPGGKKGTGPEEGAKRNAPPPVDAVVDLEGRLRVAWALPGRIEIREHDTGLEKSEKMDDTKGAAKPKDDAGSVPLPSGEPMWLSITPTTRIEGDDMRVVPTVDVLVRERADMEEPSPAVHARWSPPEKPGVVSRGAIPAGAVQEALADRHDGLHVLLRGEERFLYLRLGEGDPSDLTDDPRFPHAITALVPAGEEAGYRVHLRGITQRDTWTHVPVPPGPPPEQETEKT